MVKIGSSSICGLDNHIEERQIIEMTKQVAALVQSGIQVVLVSSGAVAAGAGLLQKRYPP